MTFFNRLVAWKWQEIAAFIAVLGAIFASLKYGARSLRWVWYRVIRHRPPVPRETVRIIPRAQTCQWSKGNVGSQPAMQVTAAWKITNISDDDVHLVAAFIKNPHTEGIVMVRGGDDRYGDFHLSPKFPHDVSTQFFVSPPAKKAGEDFKAVVVFVDQYGNEHRSKKMTFTAR